MGQKTHPVGLRLGIIRSWDSRWYAEKAKFRTNLIEDMEIRKYIEKNLGNAAIAHVEIERVANRLKLLLHTAKPGVIIGRRGAGIEELRKSLEKKSGKIVQINVAEVLQPSLDAKLVADSVVEQLEKRVAFRRAMKQAVNRSMKMGAKGIKIQCSGRLAGAEIARRERTFEGKVPLHTLKADIDFAVSEAYTTYGRIGVQVWIYRGDVQTRKSADRRSSVRGEKEVTRDVNA